MDGGRSRLRAGRRCARTLRDNFRSKLDALLASPPVSPYGKLSGYDLVDESYLPNSARYFRLIYITYHEGSPLMWQFRFYAKPDGKVALENVEWSEKNPFQYCRHRRCCIRK